MSFKITGTGSYAPARIVTNDELGSIVDTSDEWIVPRTGVHERHISETESAGDMAAQAARAALEDAGISASDLDLIIAATVSADDMCPGAAQVAQQQLGATCPAFDINAACSGFIYLLETAAGFIARGYQHVLVIGAERMSRIVDWRDRSTCVLFGDAAGALVLEPGTGYLDSILCTYGGDDVIKIPAAQGNSPFWKGVELPEPYANMDGPETMRFAVGECVRNIETILERTGTAPDDLTWVIPHQANLRIIDGARRRLKGIPADRFAVNIDRYGNTSAACIPLLIDELNRAGKIGSGDLLMLTAFGGGLTSGACLIRW
jgi:3-oxoacyl-[acyl-carrier-protein] synthase III